MWAVAPHASPGNEKRRRSPAFFVGFNRCRSVLRHAVVHVFRPGVDAAGDVEHLGEAQRTELLGGLRAAATVVAHERQRRGLRQGFQRGAAVAVEALERHADGGDGAFVSRAHVHQGPCRGCRPPSRW
ncbi:hypothetical protein G6F50_014513 [Rhizopus delemar]|uniref:Uncharacterized protein n=1 Tax=Rhizopus delemar TaxID=936053 RepID=A0A9P6Y4V4_9FUNG|nr:hypothetical protein G6F50_014513 [Rhizopus delemar]